jgi:hypothetical protein
MTEISEETKIIRNTLLWIWNTEWSDFVKIVFDVDWSESPDHEKEYLARYMDMWQTDAAQFFATLDYEKMNKITAAAKEKYGNEEDTLETIQKMRGIFDDR